MNNKPKRVTVENTTITSLDLLDSYRYGGPYNIAKHDFNNVTFKDITTFRTCIFVNCSFTDCEFINCNMEILTISTITFDYTHFINCILIGSKLQIYPLNYVNLTFTKCNMYKVTFDDVYGDISFNDCLHAPEEIITKEAIIGYKYSFNHLIVLEVPENTKYIKSTSDKCRAEKAKVISILNTDGTYSGVTKDCSYYHNDFVYKVGEIVYPTNKFDPTVTKECSAGIHFFLNIEEAKKFYIMNIGI